MAHDVFISYSTEDKPAADAVCAILESHGVRCWVAPRDIMPGADWGESIVKAIRASRVMLLVFSTNANKSKQIKREVEIAADGGVTIVPLRIENILPTESFKYFLGNIHWMDALTPPLERHLEAIAERVKAILSVDSLSREEVAEVALPSNAPKREGVSREQRETSGAKWQVLRRPRFMAALLALVLAVSVALFVGMPATTVSKLNGTWSGNDGATYVIQQNGRMISWTGGNPPLFENVFDGQITDRGYIEGDWHDLPGYAVYSSGKLRLKIESNVRLIAVSQTGNFGGTIWTKK
ncbi:toll/interleukin-1 receptor domain-containing protein [Rhizobium sp. BK251]|uniref:toll/interleukin-1 receptor domain-containing protein n=1 Tax=Rhizobium sp. BK251 TaxID=2512125 RepID=UPI0010E3A6DB|nr:toll/interleukin-1 receptor domain-containing protein [Rhizobium sp. BK251]TCL73815.1 TIR domain-containing protein [Rhizobium sp. BK251]